MQARLIPNSGERVLVVGQTGSGKTALVTHLLQHIPHAPIIIYDTKDEPKFLKLKASRAVTTMAEAAQLIEDKTVDYIVVRPDISLLNKPEMLDEMLYFHYINFHNIVAYIDEAYTFHSNGRAHSGLMALLTRGRSKGITTIISSQRPVMLSRFCVTEAQKVFALRLGDKADRKRLSDVIPNFDDKPLPPKFGFYFYEVGDEDVELFRPVPLDPSLDTGYIDTDPKRIETGSDESPVNETRHHWI